MFRLRQNKKKKSNKVKIHKSKKSKKNKPKKEPWYCVKYNNGFELMAGKSEVFDKEMVRLCGGIKSIRKPGE